MLQVVVVGMGGCICDMLQDVMVVTRTQRYTNQEKQCKMANRNRDTKIDGKQHKQVRC